MQIIISSLLGLTSPIYASSVFDILETWAHFLNSIYNWASGRVLYSINGVYAVHTDRPDRRNYSLRGFKNQSEWFYWIKAIS